MARKYLTKSPSMAMSIEEATLVALEELLYRAIYKLEDEPEVEIALTKLRAARILAVLRLDELRSATAEGGAE